MTRAYPKFLTENQLDIAVEHFIAGLRDKSTRDYLRRENAPQHHLARGGPIGAGL